MDEYVRGDPKSIIIILIIMGYAGKGGTVLIQEKRFRTSGEVTLNKDPANKLASRRRLDYHRSVGGRGGYTTWTHSRCGGEEEEEDEGRCGAEEGEEGGGVTAAPSFTFPRPPSPLPPPTPFPPSPCCSLLLRQHYSRGQGGQGATSTDGRQCREMTQSRRAGAKVEMM